MRKPQKERERADYDPPGHSATSIHPLDSSVRGEMGVLDPKQKNRERGERSEGRKDETQKRWRFGVFVSVFLEVH